MLRFVCFRSRGDVRRSISACVKYRAGIRTGNQSVCALAARHRAKRRKDSSAVNRDDATDCGRH